MENGISNTAPDTEKVLQIVRTLVGEECSNQEIDINENIFRPVINYFADCRPSSTSSISEILSKTNLCNIIIRLDELGNTKLLVLFVEELLRKASELSKIKENLLCFTAQFIEEHDVYPENAKQGLFRVKFYLQNKDEEWKSEKRLLSYLQLSPDYQKVQLMLGNQIALRKYLLEVSQYHVEMVKENLQKKYQQNVQTPKRRRVRFSEDPYQLQMMRIEHIVHAEVILFSKEENYLQIPFLVTKYLRDNEGESNEKVGSNETSLGQAIIDLKESNKQQNTIPKNSSGLFSTLRRFYPGKRTPSLDSRSLPTSVHEGFDWMIFVRQLPMRLLRIFWEVEKSPLRIFAFGLDKGSFWLAEMVNRHPIIFTMVVSALYLVVIFIWNMVCVIVCSRSYVRLGKNMVDEVIATLAGSTAGIFIQLILPISFDLSSGLVLFIAGVVCILISWLVYFHIDRATQKLFSVPKDEELEKAYNTLGALKKASNKGIKQKYLQLLIQYHPQSAQGQDVSDRDQQIMLKKFAQVEDAYKYILNARSADESLATESISNEIDCEAGGCCCPCWTRMYKSCTHPTPDVLPLRYYTYQLNEIH